MSIQAWTGDFVNVFLTSSFRTTVNQSAGGFLQAVLSNGLFLTWRGMEGLLILVSAVGVLVVALRCHRRSVKIAAGLGLFFILFAGLGGTSSLCFAVLYYTK